MAKGQEMYGVSFDFKKCFDLIPHNIMFGVLEQMGLSPRILQPMRRMYANLRRRWKLTKDGIGEEWRTTNGILQGCAVSVVLLNALVNLWLKAVEAEVGDAKPGGYADDIHATSSTPGSVQKVVNLTAEYAKLSGQEVSGKKSFTFALDQKQRRRLAQVKLNEESLKCKSSVDLLGATLVMQEAQHGAYSSKSRGGARITKVKSRLDRLRYAPLDFEDKETLAGTGVLPALLYGQAGKPIPEQVGNSLRRKALQGMWHGAGSLSCAEVAFTLLLKGHRVDPIQAADFNCFAVMRRVISKGGEAAAMAGVV